MVTFASAAVLLSLERLCYVWIWRRPATFRTRVVPIVPGAGGDPTTAVRVLFCGFKVLQAGVFLWWCHAFGHGDLWPAGRTAPVLAAGGALVLTGQILNLGVFYRLGSTGVFYGTRFGAAVPWSAAFPFSWFKHPQYVGTTLSIWGLFLILRFPYPDWYVLPLLETVYYATGAHFEQ